MRHLWPLLLVGMFALTGCNEEPDYLYLAVGTVREMVAPSPTQNPDRENEFEEVYLKTLSALEECIREAEHTNWTIEPKRFDEYAEFFDTQNPYNYIYLKWALTFCQEGQE